MTKVKPTKINSLDEALNLLDDDQLIDYILDREEDNFTDPEELKAKMLHWKNCVLMLDKLKKAKVLTLKEWSSIRELLVTEKYDAASKIVEDKMSKKSTAAQKEKLEKLAEAIHQLWQS